MAHTIIAGHGHIDLRWRRHKLTCENAGKLNGFI